MKNLINFKPRNNKYDNKEFKHKCIPYMRNEDVINYHFIVLEDTETLEVENTIYTDFLFQKKNLNLDDNTKRNICSHISMFLNYTLVNSATRIESIEELDIEYLNEFITDYDTGIIGKRKKAKTKETVQKVEQTLTKFIYWLLYNHKFNMNNFQEKDFINKLGRRSCKNKEYLESIFSLRYSDKKVSQKLKSSNLYICLNLVEVAKQYDPMIVLGIVLQMFTGMRIGEVCQMTFDRVNMIEHDELVRFFKINLLEDKILRSDGVITGNIKRRREQAVYPAFYRYIAQAYFSHKEYIDTLNLDTNTYGAVFINKNGVAITDKNYTQRLNNLLPKLNERLYSLAEAGDGEAAIAYETLQIGKITSHTFRYFYSQTLGQKLGKNPYVLAMYRGDIDLKSAMRYMQYDKSIREDIARIQDEFEKDLYKIHLNMSI